MGNIGVGDSFNGHGSNAEAIVPLDQMYKNIEGIIQKNNKNNEVSVIVQNHVFLDGKEIAYATSPYMDKQLGNIQNRRGRGGC